MSLSRFQEQWVRWAREFDLHVEVPCAVKLSGGFFEAPVLLKDFGSPRGIVLVTDWACIASVEAELVDLGFGYSCLSERTGNSDAEGLGAMLADWGWAGTGEPSSRLAALLRQ